MSRGEGGRKGEERTTFCTKRLIDDARCVVQSGSTLKKKGIEDDRRQEKTINALIVLRCIIDGQSISLLQCM